MDAARPNAVPEPQLDPSAACPNTAMYSVRLPLIALGLLGSVVSAGAISIDVFNTAVSENFDSLAATGTSSAVPPGWSFSESGTGADSTYAAGNGSSTTGNTFSFGANGSNDRALGTLLTGSLASTLGVSFLNNAGGTLTQLAIAYDGEQWRLGATGRTDRLDFAYSLDGTTWVDVDALDFAAPNSAGVTGALDGNAAANRATISYTITGLSIGQGDAFFLRWSDPNVSGSDDGLAIDNFSLTASGQAAPPPVGNSVPDQIPNGPVALLFFSLLLFGSLRRAASDLSG